jgi:hypothetical protein
MSKSDSDLFLPIAMALLAAVLAIFPVSSYDVWWILAVGNHVLDGLGIPRTGIGSWTRSSEFYVYHSWGFCVIAAAAHRIGGLSGLIVLRMILAGATFLVLTLAIVKRGARGPSVVLFPGLALLLGFTNLFWPVRPQSASQALLAVLLLFLTYLHHGRRMIFLATPFLFVLWANLHGGVILGLIVLALHALGDFIDRRRRLAENTTELSTQVQVFLLSVLACFFTPYFHGVLLSSIRHVGGTAAASAPMEWGAPKLSDFPLFIALLALAIAGVALAALSRRGRMADLLLLGLFAAMGLRSLRYLEISAVGIAYAGACVWSAALDERIPEKISRISGLVGAATLALLLAMGIGRDPYFLLGGWRPLRPLPVAAVKFLAERRITNRLANPYEWGGYLIWAFRPQNIAFVDGRADLYTADFLRDYFTMDLGDKGWRKVLGDYSVQAILWRGGPDGANLRLNLDDDGSFVRVYTDPVAVVYLRKGGWYEHLIPAGR